MDGDSSDGALLAEAEILARAMDDAGRQGRVLLYVAVVTARHDPEAAAKVAREIPAPAARRAALARVAGAIVDDDPAGAMALLEEAADTPDPVELTILARLARGADPARAAELLGAAERLARAVEDDAERVTALIAVADGMADTDRERARALLREAERAVGADPLRLLGACAEGAARIDAEDARRIADAVADLACAVPDDADGADHLRSRAVIHTRAADPVQARRIAVSIGGAEAQARAMGHIAGSLAATDPARAERLARSAPTRYGAAVVLPFVAAVLADPAEAVRLVEDAERIALEIPEGAVRTNALCYVAAALARHDPERADALIQPLVTTPFEQVAAGMIANLLAQLADPGAEWVLQPDPDLTEQRAREIGDEYRRALALIKIAAGRSAAAG